MNVGFDRVEGGGADTAAGTIGGEARVCVLDVESAIADDVMVYLPAGDTPTVRRSSLLRLTAVSALRFAVTPDGIADIELSSVSDGAEEDEMVMCAEEALSWLGDAGTVVTHNGVAHDLPLIARRAMRTWMFERAPTVLEWGRRPGDRHFDTSISLGVGSLVDLCAGLGIPATLPRRGGGRSGSSDERARKCELDVAATAVAYLHARAGELGSSLWLAAAWRDLARPAEPIAARSPHAAGPAWDRARRRSRGSCPALKTQLSLPSALLDPARRHDGSRGS